MFTSFRAHFISSFFLLCACFSAQTALASFSPGFIENKGQLKDQAGRKNGEVLFLFSAPGMNVQLRKTGYSYELLSPEGMPVLKPGQKFTEPFELRNARLNTSRIDIEFSSPQKGMQVIAEQETGGRLNYFLNGEAITGVGSFKKITYKNVFPATDLEFVIAGGAEPSVKYNVILHSGADPAAVKFLVKGAGIEKIAEDELQFKTPLGLVSERIPESYYADAPAERIKAKYLLQGNTISFSAAYNRSKGVVIDPSSSRIWGTYYGGSSLDYCTATGVDAVNNVYITGYTLSTSSIATAGAYQSVLSGSYDVYLAKFDPSGNRLWATYYGGNSFEQAFGMYVSPAGIIYICGDTFSTSGVATAAAHQTTYGGGIDDAILVKFDSAGQLKWATYYGGNMHDIALGVTEDAAGNVILAGHTESAAAIATAGSWNSTFMGGYDVFVAKFDSTGVRQWGTYYGELDVEEAFSVVCDPPGNIYVTGFTTSANDIATPSGFQTGYSGQQDAFVAKFNPSGSTLLYGTYYGGPGNDQGTCIRLSSTGNIIITGNTTSTVGIAAPGAWQPSIGSADDGFLVRFNAAGARIWGTYFGGDDVDYIGGFVLDGNENIVFAGSTLSTTQIATAAAYQPAIGIINNYDAYLERFDLSGIREVGSYYGGTANDHGRAITMDGTGKFYICGETQSVGIMASPAAFDTTWSGSDDAFLAKFCLAPKPILFPAGPSTICKNDTLWISAQNGFATYLWNEGSTGNPLITPDTLSLGTYYYTVTVSDGAGCDAMSDTAVVIVDLCSSIAEQDAGAFEVFPVPAPDILFVKWKGNTAAEMTIYSSTGQLVYENRISGNNSSADIKKLSPGIYILQVRAGDTLYQKRFVKE
jgi:hypothetical protein